MWDIYWCLQEGIRWCTTALQYTRKFLVIHWECADSDRQMSQVVRNNFSCWHEKEEIAKLSGWGYCRSQPINSGQTPDPPVSHVYIWLDRDMCVRILTTEIVVMALKCTKTEIVRVQKVTIGWQLKGVEHVVLWTSLPKPKGLFTPNELFFMTEPFLEFEGIESQQTHNQANTRTVWCSAESGRVISTRMKLEINLFGWECPVFYNVCSPQWTSTSHSCKLWGKHFTWEVNHQQQRYLQHINSFINYIWQFYGYLMKHFRI